MSSLYLYLESDITVPDNFKENLRLLCSYYKSTSEVCRRLGINRPQFNRYLNGTNRPSANTMRRFCEFFGVEEGEITLPHAQFQCLVQVRPAHKVNSSTVSLEQRHCDNLQHISLTGQDKYLGYYFEYYISMACPGKILRTLVCIELRDGKMYFQRTERLREEGRAKPFHGIYKGIAYFLADRIFLMDYETLTGHEVTQTILFPSFKNRIDRLTGLKLGVSGSGERMPCCARVVYEHLGKQVNKREALALCGLYDVDSEQIDMSIRQAITNAMESSEWHFRARF
ncbi:Helix-turn-helix domain protein [Marinomonas spartinae]|uniref:Helix-turn-helix domain protein n=1 Tax=Marinomonas spartinae TaxID=1792290 RepID=A0A1A8TBW3_9GAMM|nr:helix-turn-helix transcriptional regulator [Marinomonas spartinae]SBS30193.1 Helix-turn-helix domain protein [Marinomonas spartinae]